MKTFAVLNQKGGTGKTTVTLNLAAALAAGGRRILVIDTDPQGNTTSASGVDKNALANGIYSVLHGAPVSANLYCSPAFGYHLLPANARLAGAEVELAADDDWQDRLRRAVADIADDFDFAFIDCPPSLGILTVNALCAADFVLIPMQCEYFALEGLSDLAETIRRLREGLNPALTIAGIVRTMLDSRNLLAQQVSDELRAHFGDKVFAAVIPRNVRLAEAPSHQLPIFRYAPHSTGALGYRALCDEFLRRYA